MKVLIFVGFDDIGYDMDIFGWIGWKVGILVEVGRILFVGLIFKFV